MDKLEWEELATRKQELIKLENLPDGIYLIGKQDGSVKVISSVQERVVSTKKWWEFWK